MVLLGTVIQCRMMKIVMERSDVGQKVTLLQRVTWGSMACPKASFKSKESKQCIQRQM